MRYKYTITTTATIYSTNIFENIMQNFDTCAKEAQTPSQLRGVWHRPSPDKNEGNLDELCAVLDRFKRSGINTVFLETFYHGMTIYKTDKVPYYTGFDAYSFGGYPDYLTAFAAEANKRGIQVHAWVQDFYVGYREDAALAAMHPEWLLVNQQGGLRHTTEGREKGGYVFLDPANPEVRAFLIDLYDELLTKVPLIGGLNLDYIRYPISEFGEDTDTGYTETCMDDFAKRQNLTLDPSRKREDLIEQIKSRDLLAQWTAHRAYYITWFVRDVYEMIQKKHAGKIVSTAVFPELAASYNMKKQTIRVWLEKKDVDMVTPMVYFFETEKVYDAVKNIKSICGDIHCYTGLYTTYHSQSCSDLAEHIAASERAGAEGFVLFDSARTFREAKEDYESFLSEHYGKA